VAVQAKTTEVEAEVAVGRAGVAAVQAGVAAVQAGAPKTNSPVWRRKSRHLLNRVPQPNKSYRPFCSSKPSSRTGPRSLHHHFPRTEQLGEGLAARLHCCEALQRCLSEHDPDVVHGLRHRESIITHTRHCSQDAISHRFHFARVNVLERADKDCFKSVAHCCTTVA
jgi:hypothetical protein